jgi:hypothetical protein
MEAITDYLLRSQTFNFQKVTGSIWAGGGGDRPTEGTT